LLSFFLPEPSFVLPNLVNLIYAPNGKVQSSATETLLGVLKHHKEDFDVICMLLTSLSNIQALDTAESNGHSTEGLTFDSDRVLKLIPEWARSVSTRIRHACFAIFEINPFLFLKCMYRHHLRTVGALLNRKW
jgi:hypothetical protein